MGLGAEEEVVAGDDVWVAPPRRGLEEIMDGDEEDEDTTEDCDDADDDDSITDLISLSAPFGSSMELLPFVRDGKYRDGLSAFT